MRISNAELHNYEFRGLRTYSRQDGSKSVSAMFEDPEMNQLSIGVDNDADNYLASNLVKGTLYTLYVHIITGTSKNGNSYEMIRPAAQPFAVAQADSMDY